MEKTISLSNKEYKLKSSLFSIISYKNTFGTELFSDISSISEIKDQSEYGKVIDTIFKVTYILHKPFTSITYDEFLGEFDFSILSNQSELENLAKTISEMLGTLKNE
jgi:hypothetical protein